MESLDSRLDKARVTSRMLGLLGSRLCLAARVECIYPLDFNHDLSLSKSPIVR